MDVVIPYFGTTYAGLTCLKYTGTENNPTWPEPRVFAIRPPLAEEQNSSNYSIPPVISVLPSISSALYVNIVELIPD